MLMHKPGIVYKFCIYQRNSTKTLSPHFNSHFPGGPGLARYQNVSILDFIGAKDDVGGGDNWSYKTCKAPVKMSPPTNQHPVYYRPDALLSPNQQCHSSEGKGKEVTYIRKKFYKTKKVNVKFTILHKESVGRYSSPCPRPWARRWRTTNVLCRVASVMPDLQLPSQPQGNTACWLVFQIILLCDRGTYVLTTCQRLHWTVAGRDLKSHT